MTDKGKIKVFDCRGFIDKNVGLLIISKSPIENDKSADFPD